MKVTERTPRGAEPMDSAAGEPLEYESTEEAYEKLVPMIRPILVRHPWRKAANPRRMPRSAKR